MSSLIYRLGRPSITRRESTRIAVSSSTEAISPGSEDLILEDNILPVRSSLLTTSIVSPLRRAMKLSGVLEGVPSSVGSTSHHTSSPRRKQLQVHSMEQTSKPDRTAKNLNTTPHTISKHAPSELPDLEIQVYLPVMQLTEPEIPLELKVHSETTVKDLISLSVDQDPRLTGNWTLRPVQDHFVDYEHQAPDPLDRVRLLDSRAFALSLANSEDDRRIRPTHRRCYTLPSNGNALLDMPSNVPGQLQAGAKYFRVRVDLAKSAESLQIYVYSHSSEIQDLTQCICKKLYGAKQDAATYNLIGQDVQGILRPIPVTRRVMTFAEHTEFILVCLKDRRSRSESLSGIPTVSTFDRSLR